MAAFKFVLVESKRCPFCYKSEYFEVDWSLFSDWMFGEANIKDALPDLTDAERERFITGICPSCWNIQLGEED